MLTTLEMLLHKGIIKFDNDKEGVGSYSISPTYVIQALHPVRGTYEEVLGICYNNNHWILTFIKENRHLSVKPCEVIQLTIFKLIMEL